MGVDGLHAGARGNRASVRLARRQARLQEAVHNLDGDLRRRVPSLRRLVEPEFPDRRAGPPGRRRRNDNAHDDGDDLQDGPSREDRRRHGDIRHGPPRGPGVGPDHRGLPGRVRRLALDIHHQPPHRGRGDPPLDLRPAGVPVQASGQARPGRGGELGLGALLPPVGLEQGPGVGLARREDHPPLRDLPLLLRPLHLPRAELRESSLGAEGIQVPLLHHGQPPRGRDDGGHVRGPVLPPPLPAEREGDGGDGDGPPR